MTGRAGLRGPRALMLAVVVTGLLIGLVGMHHLSVAPDTPTPVPASSHMADPVAPVGQPHDNGGGHESGLLHLCLAILTAFALLVISAAAWRRPGAVMSARRAGVRRAWTAPRAPASTALARLALLCVLRT